MSGRTRTDTKMSIHAHIKELRTRLFVVALIFIATSMAVYMLRDPVIAILLSPLNGEKLSYLTPGGGFSFIFKVVMWGGIALSLPFIVYNLYKFVSPILPVKAQRKSGMVLVASFLLLCAGATFGYVYAIPGAMRFLLTFADGYVSAMLTADAYLNFVLVYTVGLGVLFQIPLLMVAVNWITPLRPKKLLAFERYVIVGAFIIAALITPTPDAVNQTIIAAPVVGMYQVGFIAVALSQRSANRARRAQERSRRKTSEVRSKLGKGMLRTYQVQLLVERKLQQAASVQQAAPKPAFKQAQPLAQKLSPQPQRAQAKVVDPFMVRKHVLPAKVSRTIQYERSPSATRRAGSIDGMSDRMYRIRPSVS